MCWLFEDPYAAARPFYGPAFPAMLEAERARERDKRVAAQIAPQLVDDAASQIVGGVEPWRVAWALGFCDVPNNSL